MEIDGVFKFLLFVVLKSLAFLIDICLDALFGFTIKNGTREDQHKAQTNYEFSAQYVKVIWRAKTMIYSMTTAEDFLYKHVKYVHPDYISRNKNVTLLDIEKDYALFSVTDVDVNINNTEQFPFVFVSQYLEARHLIILPIKSFHRLADELGDPKVPVAVAYMTARCGSTLVTQMLNKVPGTRALAENWATCRLTSLRHKGIITPEESRRLLKSGIRLHCKISPGESVERVFLKFTTYNGPLSKELHSMFPQIALIFNTRHPTPSVKSYWQVWEAMSSTLDFKLGLHWKANAIDFKSFLPFDDQNPDILAANNTWFPAVGIDAYGVIFYAGSLACYMRCKEIYDYILYYENLAENPEREMKEVFRLMKIPQEHLQRAISGMKKDSQNKTFGKRGQGRSYQLSPETLAYMDNYFQKLNLPIKHDMTFKEFKDSVDK